MTKFKVTLLAYTQGVSGEQPEELTALFKRICNSGDSWETLKANNTPRNQNWRNKQTLKPKGGGSAHMGVLEHVSFTFLIEGVSRVMTHQLVRHRIASYLQMSQRVVPMEELDIIVPPSIKSTRFEIDFINFKRNLTRFYSAMVDDGIEAGDARYIMPHGMETRLIMTINARSLLHLLNERFINPHAQWEIKAIAEEMYEIVHKVCPILIDKELSDRWE